MTQGSERVAVLMLAYGGPASLDHVEPFLRRIMAPREPSEEALARAVDRYRAIGGRSPLVENTLYQARLLQERLDLLAASAFDLDARRVSFEVIPGMRHTEPTIDEAVRRGVEVADETVIALIMASHQSERATGAYLRDVAASFAALSAEERSEVEPPIYVEAWHTSPLFLRAVADRVAEASRVWDQGLEGAAVLFTAHSLPVVDDGGDPVYEQALKATIEGVMDLIGDHRWSLAYQSASPARGGRWLGPRVEDALGELAVAGFRKVVVTPLGFVSEHLETLYDLDIELAREAREAGVEMVRAGTVHDSPAFMEALAQSVIGCQRGGSASRQSDGLEEVRG
ncbi:MAG: ferrochelatase [Thermoleophilia bacterium]